MEKNFFEAFPNLKLTGARKDLFEQVVVERITATRRKDILRIYIKSDTKLLENSSTAVLCWPQRKGDSTMTLGEKIASARKEKGMTQEMLAEQLGVTRQAVARWETGVSHS